MKQVEKQKQVKTCSSETSLDFRWTTLCYTPEDQNFNYYFTNVDYNFLLVSFSLWLYSPIQAFTASMKLSVSLQLLDLGGQSVGLPGRVIS
jgi:hypothetical protein